MWTLMTQLVYLTRWKKSFLNSFVNKLVWKWIAFKRIYKRFTFELQCKCMQKNWSKQKTLNFYLGMHRGPWKPFWAWRQFNILFVGLHQKLIFLNVWIHANRNVSARDFYGRCKTGFAVRETIILATKVRSLETLTENIFSSLASS